MKPIGGYFELELQPLVKKNEGLLFNSGRSALAFLLQTHLIEKVYLPYYTCDAVLEPILKLNLPFQFYHIDANLLPEYDFSSIDARSAIIVNNYFGLLDKEINELSYKQNMIVDNSQALFSIVSGGFGSFNSFRKFIGVADGARISLSDSNQMNFDNEVGSDLEEEYRGFNRFYVGNSHQHLIGRIESGPEKFYKEYVESEKNLKFEKVLRISKFSQRVYQSIDFERIIRRRRENFTMLNDALKHLNNFRHEIPSSVPMVYPLWIENGEALRIWLIKNKVYVPKYWENENVICPMDSLESEFLRNIVPLPIDQRYAREDMKRIIDTINNFEN